MNSEDCIVDLYSLLELFGHLAGKQKPLYVIPNSSTLNNSPNIQQLIALMPLAPLTTTTWSSSASEVNSQLQALPNLLQNLGQYRERVDGNQVYGVKIEMPPNALPSTWPANIFSRSSMGSQPVTTSTHASPLTYPSLNQPIPSAPLPNPEQSTSAAETYHQPQAVSNATQNADNYGHVVAPTLDSPRRIETGGIVVCGKCRKNVLDHTHDLVVHICGHENAAKLYRCTTNESCGKRTNLPYAMVKHIYEAHNDGNVMGTYIVDDREKLSKIWIPLLDECYIGKKAECLKFLTTCKFPTGTIVVPPQDSEEGT